MRDPIKVEGDEFIISPKEMEANKRYTFTYRKRNYVAVKWEDETIEIFEVDV